MSAVDGMSLIAHCVPGCPACRAPIDGQTAWHEPGCERRNDEALKVEVVRASDHQGAVEALREIRDCLHPFVKGGEPAAEDAADVYEIAARALDGLGGQ